MVERGVKMYTFDVRLSHTAAKSTEWLPIVPGTDGAVALAMCRVIMDAGLYDKETRPGLHMLLDSLEVFHVRASR